MRHSEYRIAPAQVLACILFPHAQRPAGPPGKIRGKAGTPFVHAARMAKPRIAILGNRVVSYGLAIPDNIAAEKLQDYHTLHTRDALTNGPHPPSARAAHSKRISAPA